MASAQLSCSAALPNRVWPYTLPGKASVRQRISGHRVEQISDAPGGTSIRRPWPLAALLVFFLGLAALLADSLKLQQPRILNVHLLFGVVLLAVVARCLLSHSHALRNSRSEQFYLYTRQLARQVYILLYVMAAVRLCLYVIEAAEAGNGRRVFSYLSRPGSLDDFHVYIAYGLAAACLIRGTAMFWHAPGWWVRR
jgi:cytochrome b561